MSQCVILVGHGGVPTDCPPELVSTLKRLEAQAKGRMTPELGAVDQKVRRWPRTEKTDPYKSGLEAVAAALARALPEHFVLLAYNEFCAPTLEEAFAEALSRGASSVTVVSTMYTRGGVHSEREIPEIVAALRRAHPEVTIKNVWPFELSAVAGMLAAEVRRVERAQAAA